MRLVAIESPFAPPSLREPCTCAPCSPDELPQYICDRCARVCEERYRHTRYLDACLLDCYQRGEAPFASHAIGPRVLDDAVSLERETGMAAGAAWAALAEVRAVYVDLYGGEYTAGMRAGIEEAKRIGQRIEFRVVPGWRP